MTAPDRLIRRLERAVARMDAVSPRLSAHGF